jgi:hypothetical protein
VITHIGRNHRMLVKTHVTVSEQPFPATGERVNVLMPAVQAMSFYPIAPIVDAQGNLWQITPGGIERIG